MAAVLPSTREGMIQWFEQRLTAWAADPPAIGLTPAQAVELLTLTTNARTSLDSAIAARNAAKAATPEYHDDAAALRAYGGELVKLIKAYAETTGDSAVYTTAQVPPPAEPSPKGAPGSPENLTGKINNAGEIELAWNPPSGGFKGNVYFTLQRRFIQQDGTVTAWISKGNTGDKKYTDADVPVGYAAVSYRARAWRGSDASDFTDPVEILFGSNADEVIATIGDTTAEAA